MKEPFPLIKYSDSDNNGFFDQVNYDLDGDKNFEVTVSLQELGVNDQCSIIDLSEMDYNDLVKLEQKVANDMWQQAQNAADVAKAAGIDLQWYSLLMHPKSTRQKYHMGYWLQLYILKDLVQQAYNQNKGEQAEKYIKAFHSAGWRNL